MGWVSAGFLWVRRRNLFYCLEIENGIGLKLELELILGVKMEDDRGVSTIHLRWTCRVLEHTVSYILSISITSHHTPPHKDFISGCKTMHAFY
jgi:hypothetical protein